MHAPPRLFQAGSRTLRVRMVVWSGIVGAAALVACSGDDDGAPAAQVADSAGVRIVTVPAGGFDQPAPFQVHLAPHLRVGALDGPETELLTSPGAVARLSDGRIFLVEDGARRARLLESDGEFIRWIGQVGDGPAEYRFASGGGVLPGDTLWIHDGGRRRLVLFDPDGSEARTIPYEAPGGAQRVLFIRLLSDGTLVHLGTTLSGLAAAESQGSLSEEVLLHFLGPDDEEPRRVAHGPGSTYRTETSESTPGQRMVLIQLADPTFTPLLRMEVDREGRIWKGDGDGFEVHRLDEEGTLREIFRGGPAPRPFTPTDRRVYEELSLERAPEQAREGFRRNLAQREYAQVLPAFSRLVADEAGRLWIPEFMAHRPGEEPRSWWVLEPGGDFLGRVDVPPGLRVLRIRDDELLGVETDDFDVPYLVGYSLESSH